MYDLIIMGAGIAGMTGAIYAARAKLHTLVLERGMSGGQALQTPEIENYPGVPHTDGFTLSTAIAEQAANLGAEIRTALITGWEQADDHFIVHTAGEDLTARALLIATGATHRPLGVEGEARLRGHGVSYCATCDGRFYKDRAVAVVGGGNTAAEDALYLSRLCSKVTLIHRRDALRAQKALAEQIEAAENIEVLWNTTVSAIEGDAQVQRLQLRTNGEARTLATDGVFVAVGVQPNNELCAALPQDEAGFVIADENGQTAIPGVFVAGDLRAKRCRQLITAAADGAAAVSAAGEWLSRR